MAEYAHPELLASTDWLAQHLNDPSVKILDARGADDYAERHIPGALLLPNNVFRATSGIADTCSADEFRETAGSLGVAAGDTVICYDAAGGPAGGRAWWAFSHFGHADARYLNGGWRAWQRAGEPTATEPTHPRPTTYELGELQHLHCSLDQALKGVDIGDILFWDVRTPGEFDGTDRRTNAEERAGHIPRAVRLEWNELVDADTGLFKPADEMRRILTAKGITPDANVLTY